MFLAACSSSSLSPVGSLTSRYPQTGMCLDAFEGSSSPRYGLTDPISANLEGAVMFEAPELPEETLMEVNVCLEFVAMQVFIIN